MQGHLFGRSQNPVGIDLGNYSIKIAKIKKEPFSKKPILAFAAIPVQDTSSRQNMVEAIKQGAKGLAIETQKVNLSISGPHIIMRYIILPFMKEADLAKSLEFELEKYVPYKREEAVINYHILTKIPNNQMIVLLVAAQRAIIQERVAMLKEAGLEPRLITVDSLALCEVFKALYPRHKGVAAIVDIGYRLSKLVVLENNIPVFSRDIEIGEYDIIQMIADRLNTTYPQAKELASRENEAAHQALEAAKTELHSFLNELSLSFEYCERNLEKTVGQLYLCGGGSRIKIMADFLARIPNMKVSILDVAQGFKLSAFPRTEEPEAYASLLAAAAGIALS